MPKRALLLNLRHFTQLLILLNFFATVSLLFREKDLAIPQAVFKILKGVCHRNQICPLYRQSQVKQQE
jgi:hypothetical protein